MQAKHLLPIHSRRPLDNQQASRILQGGAYPRYCEITAGHLSKLIPRYPEVKIFGLVHGQPLFSERCVHWPDVKRRRLVSSDGRHLGQP